MESIITVIHYLICFFLIVVILLQAGKGADIGAVFGGASQTVFGGRGPTTFLNKMTVFVAIGFLITSISLAYMAKNRHATSVFDSQQTTTAPATPDQPTTAVPPPASGTPAAPAEQTGTETK